jgi:glycine cleavage system H protein
MDYPKEYRYSKEHEWVSNADGVATIGITQYAVTSLGDVVYVDLPAVGDTVEQFGKFGEVESVKAVSDLFSPVSGEVVEVNSALANDPAAINDDPFANGWLVKIKLGNPAELPELMDAEKYLKFIDEL